ncbi:MAG: hypothetical protein ACOYN5_02850 [Bacteroidales bacterium]
MRVSLQILAIVSLTILFAILIVFLKQQFYQDIRISFEVRIQNDESCQLFYGKEGQFNEIQSIVKSYTSSNSFETIVFEPPVRQIKNFRFDPGYTSLQYELRTATIIVGDSERIWQGDNILNAFEPIYLEAISDGDTDVLTLKPKDNPDAQLLFRQNIDDVFDLFDQKSWLLTIYFLITIYLTMLLVIVFAWSKSIERLNIMIITLINCFHRRKLFRFILLIISGITPFLILAFYLQTKVLALDWGYFNSLSLVVKSNIWQYHSFPLHNPWVGGGIDILANPQSRVFSPLVLFDILLNAPWANLLSFVILSITGVIGFYFLLRYLKFSRAISFVVSIIYINATWFSLHFSVGHIPFGAFQLMGLIYYFILRIEEKSFKYYFSLLSAFLVINGSFYVFIYALFLLTFVVLSGIHRITIKSFVFSIFSQWKTVAISLLVFVFISSVKFIPFIMLHKGGIQYDQFQRLPLINVLYSFFWPYQYPGLIAGNTSILFSFHEYGNYIGIPGFLIIAFFFISNPKSNAWRFALTGLFFFILGAGLLHEFNLWPFWYKIPIISGIRVHPRLFIFCYLSFIILLAFALTHLKGKVPAWIYGSVVVFLIFESIITSAIPYYHIYQNTKLTHDVSAFKKLIESENLEKTVTSSSPDYGSGLEFQHYFKKNTGSKNTYEPFIVRGKINAITDKEYRGESYPLSGQGTVKLEKYTPGYIKISYNLDTISDIQVNTNYLLGWKAIGNEIQVYKKNGLLTFKPISKKGDALIIYSPDYFQIIIIMFLSGLVIIILSFSMNSYFKRIGIL